MNEEDIEELKRLFYSNRLTQYGKRKLIEYYEQRIEELEEYEEYYKEQNEVNAKFIPKSKVEEKIEIINKRIDYLNTELNKCYIERDKLGTETDIDNNEMYIFYMEQEKSCRYVEKTILEELLQEGE